MGIWGDGDLGGWGFGDFGILGISGRRLSPKSRNPLNPEISVSMKAMLLRASQPVDTSPLELVDVPTPEPGPGEVRIRVHCCGRMPYRSARDRGRSAPAEIARHSRPSDRRHGRSGGRGKGEGKEEGGDKDKETSRQRERVLVADSEISPSPLLPLSPSRSPSPLSPLPSIGQRVGVAWLRHTCGHCGYCLAGRENLCESARFTGYHADGGYAEYAVAPADFVYPLPEAFSDVEAAPLLCAGIIGYRALRRCNLRPGGTLALIGFGSSAHVVIQIALHRGCRVLVATRGENHRELARKMGAAWVGENPTEMPERADSAILFAPAGELVLPALERLNKGGTLSLAGIYLTPIPSLDYERHLFYEATFILSPATRVKTAASCWPRPPPSPSVPTPPSIRWRRPTGPCKT